MIYKRKKKENKNKRKKKKRIKEGMKRKMINLVQ
jgi:hypothetical protein